MLNKIAENISYIQAVEEPILSADVGIIRSGGRVWIYDVGNGDDIVGEINLIQGEKNIVLSHFHADHITNLDKISHAELYGGNFTCKKLKKGIPVDKDMFFDGIHLFPIPSTHSKGCVGLEYGGYAFLGDSTYCTETAGRAAYNAGLLRETIKTLKALKAETFLLSHNRPIAGSKERVVAKLEKIYSFRTKNEPYIFMDEILKNF